MKRNKAGVKRGEKKEKQPGSVRSCDLMKRRHHLQICRAQFIVTLGGMKPLGGRLDMLVKVGDSFHKGRDSFNTS